jgi:hypothetical protein
MSFRCIQEDIPMDRHVTDKPRNRTQSLRLREFLRLDREETRHPAYEALHRKPHAAGTRKLQEFTRIERTAQD